MPGFVDYLKYHNVGAKMTHDLQPSVKSLAHNKYQVAGRQLSLFITLDQTKLLFCCQLFLFVFLDDVDIQLVRK